MPTVSALTFAYNIALSAIVLIIPLYLRDLGAGPVLLGLAASLPPLVQLFLRLPSGAASDRWGERTVLLISSAAMAGTAMLLMASAAGPAKYPIVAALLLSGLSRAIYWPSAQSYASRVSRHDLTRSLGLFTSIGHVGAIIGTPLAGALLVSVGFGGGFALILAGSALCGLAALRLQRKPAVTGDKASRPRAYGGFLASVGQMLRSRPLLLAGLCMAGAGVPQAMLSSFYPVYLADLGLRQDTIGLLSSFRAVAAMLSSLWFGLVAARVPVGWAWFAGAGLCGLGIGLTPFLSSFPALALAMGLAGLSSGLLQVLSMSIAAKASDSSNRAQAMAFSGLFFSLSLWAVPIGMGIVAQIAGLRVGFAGLGLIWVALAALLAPRAAAMTGGQSPAAAG